MINQVNWILIYMIDLPFLNIFINIPKTCMRFFDVSRDIFSAVEIKSQNLLSK